MLLYSRVDNIQLSILLPSYQEEENLRLLLPRIIDQLKYMSITWEVIVIGPSNELDYTKELCKSLDIIYVKRSGGDAYGNAVRTGINKASGKYLIFMDSDGSHPPELIPKLYAFREGYDVVIASRYVDDGFTENSLFLVWMSRVLNIIYSVVLDISCNDISNSFRLYDAGKLKSITLKCNNFDIVEEILVKLSRTYKLLKIKEISFTFKKRMFGRTKRKFLLFMFTYFLTLFKLKFLV